MMAIFQFFSDVVLNWAVNLLLVAGVVSFSMSFMFINWVLLRAPALAAYYRIIQVVSVVLLVLGLFLKGALYNEQVWRMRAAQLQERIEAAQAASKEVNTIIEERVVYVDRVIRERGERQIEYVDRVIKEIEEVRVFEQNCPIPESIIDAHNEAATPPKLN
jgi:hypothetical protein